MDTPCGDAFLATLATNAAGPVPPVRVTAAPAVIAPGGSLQVAWGGIVAPSAEDHLQVCSLGSWGSSSCEVMSPWGTDCAACGAWFIPLPPDLAPGWYDVRLLGRDTDDPGFLEPISRSAPIRVSAAPSTAAP